eukprot:CAMPEP_0119037034 /NCGR_PEP_ID=MMETSP1177-20130426/5129_1 /TAXON_ID=2985 /ORGANISM="Ochromonas sp, Strain CCMP1899" /LENGTH=521 /DNA_ID=CAMNT_0006997723 /DNA_START=102 /DNA_END=1664 /DNA_ORIENTATION=-
MDNSKDNQAVSSSSSSSSSTVDKKQTKSDLKSSELNSSNAMVEDSDGRLLKEALKCPICFDLLATPCLFPKCGHMFCCKCAHTLNSPCCPVCRESSEEMNLVRVFNMDAITAEEAVRLWGENNEGDEEDSVNNNLEYKSWILRRDEGLALVASAMKLTKKVPAYDEGEVEDSSDNISHDSDDDDSDDECDCDACDDGHTGSFLGFNSSRDNTPKSYFSQFEGGSSLGGTNVTADIADLSVEEKAEQTATVRKRRFAAYNDKNAATSSSSTTSITEASKEGNNLSADRELCGNKKITKTSTANSSEVEDVGCQSSSSSHSSSSPSAIIVSPPISNLSLEQKQRAKDMVRIKREKMAQKAERERLRAEITRDREDRRLNKGILSVGHALGGVKGATMKAATETLIKANDSGALEGQDLDEKITAAIELIMKTRVEDAVPAMSLILSILKNIIAHPDESKYRTINASGRIFKERADHIVGVKALLNSLGFKNVPLPPIEGVGPSPSDNQSRLTLPQGDIKLIEN